MLTASGDGTANIYDAQNGQLLAGPLQHGKVVWSAWFSPNGEQVVTASADGTARLWDGTTGAWRARLKGTQTKYTAAR